MNSNNGSAGPCADQCVIQKGRALQKYIHCIYFIHENKNSEMGK